VVDPALMEEFDDHDTLMVIMQTALGKQCHINCCREASYGYDQRFEILGSKGMLQNDNLRPSTVRRFTAAETEAREPLLNFFLQRYTEAYRNELDAFLQALKSGSPLPTTPWDGRQALRLAEAAIESVRTGHAVAV
jgi:myo-inositol 2-dehydrogenase / D-chiro-inositol 1-dehydrogenase